MAAAVLRYIIFATNFTLFLNFVSSITAAISTYLERMTLLVPFKKAICTHFIVECNTIVMY